MDPATLAMLISGIGAGEKLIGGGGAFLQGNESTQFQEQNLANALAGLERASGQRLGAAGGLRTDQFGNATYYDPTQQRWITSYSPQQQRLIDEGQARQERTNIRGAQASQDYDKLRGEYLYSNKPKTEAESYAELLGLIQNAQGQGDRALSTLVNRQFLRQQGNMPVINATQYGEKTPGQQLALQLLQARGGALDESIKRQQAHQSEYLPALQEFERTANTVGQVDPTGNIIKQMEQQGRSDVLGAQSDYEKLLGDLFTKGGTNVAHSYDTAVKGAAALGAGGGSGGAGNLSALTKALAGGSSGGGTLGDTTGATYSGGGGGGGYTYGQIGGEAAPFGGAPRLASSQSYDPYATSNVPQDYEKQWYF
jgi:hypothetical protein